MAKMRDEEVGVEAMLQMRTWLWDVEIQLARKLTVVGQLVHGIEVGLFPSACRNRSRDTRLDEADRVPRLALCN